MRAAATFMAAVILVFALGYLMGCPPAPAGYPSQDEYAQLALDEHTCVLAADSGPQGAACLAAVRARFCAAHPTMTACHDGGVP